MRESIVAYLGLGSNLGDRAAAIGAGLARLDGVPGVSVVARSDLRETEPVGGPPQPPFLNGAASVRTTLPPHALLAVLKAVEADAGRRVGPRNGPRPLDLDLLLYGEARIDTRDLVVPHPRLFEREFVLGPLEELGVDLRSIPRWERPEVVQMVDGLRARTAAWRCGGCTIGLVPTMGALHDGHASLMRRARAECDRVVVTSFVNPKQFGPSEDLARYPRTPEQDLDVCRGERVDLVFVPTVDAVYGAGFCSEVAVGREAEGLDGASRPGHFRGVATVVVRLWNLVGPDRAYLGEKDAQQVAVLRRAHADLGLSGTLVPCAIVREPDGLALSSRNVMLAPDDRRAAVVLHEALAAARAAHEAGERDAQTLLAIARGVLEREHRCELDYLELRRLDDVLPRPPGPVERARLLVAARFGRPPTRLIDNVALGARSTPGPDGDAS